MEIYEVTHILNCAERHESGNDPRSRINDPSGFHHRVSYELKMTFTPLSPFHKFKGSVPDGCSKRVADIEPVAAVNLS